MCFLFLFINPTFKNILYKLCHGPGLFEFSCLYFDDLALAAVCLCVFIPTCVSLLDRCVFCVCLSVCPGGYYFWTIQLFLSTSARPVALWIFLKTYQIMTNSFK